jgi:long-chain acyl-CoA synthetase
MGVTSVDAMIASPPIDEWAPPWESFAHFLQDDGVADAAAAYMLELRDDGIRREWTRAEWRDRIQETAWWLQEHGIAPGRAVAVLAGNSADALAVAFACWAHGWVYVPLNAHEPAERHQFVLNHARAQILLYADAMEPTARDAGLGSSTPTLPLSAVGGPWRSASAGMPGQPHYRL